MSTQAIAEAAQGLRKYPDPMAEVFRRQAAELWNVGPDWILGGNGSDDILTIVTRTLVGQGQLLRLPYPSYILYKTLGELQGARSEEIRFNADWSLPDEFAEGCDDLRVVFLANPNSPSGTVVSPQKILEIAERLPCPLLVDEAYVDFAEVNCMSLVAKCEKIMVSRTLSKSYALAGLRFGYIVAQPQIIEQLVKVKDSYNCDALAIAVSIRKGFKAEDFAELHPGGKLGKRLAKVRDLMHAGDEVPVVSTSTPMSDVIYEMSSKKLGITTVQEKGLLRGVISDGDLRRLLEREGGAALCRTAGEAMNAHPRTIGAGELAATALAILEERKITSLVVVDAAGTVEGVLHLHDLWGVELI